jgi:hypothetical protein
MDLVTLAHVTLHRVGSVSGIAFPSNRCVDKVVEVRDGSIEILRALVVSIAEEHGELPGNLRNLRQDHTGHYTNRPDRIVFNIQGPNVQYSTPYAEIHSHPALKIGTRYFKLDEVAV